MKSLRCRGTILLFCTLALVACKPSENKPVASAASAGQAASAQATNTLQPSFSGEYATLSIPQPAEQGSKVEVLEFFAYFCSHCKTFDPAVTAWAKKNRNTVVFKRVPVAFRANMIAQQRMYYALESMGALESLHPKIFHAVQDEHLALSNDQEVLAYVTKHDIDISKFTEHYNSSSVQSKAAQAQNVTTGYKVESVPLFAIDGRYVTAASYATKRPNVPQTEAGHHAATLAIIGELVAKTLKERSSKK